MCGVLCAVRLGEEEDATAAAATAPEATVPSMVLHGRLLRILNDRIGGRPHARAPAGRRALVQKHPFDACRVSLLMNSSPWLLVSGGESVSR